MPQRPLGVTLSDFVVEQHRLTRCTAQASRMQNIANKVMHNCAYMPMHVQGGSDVDLLLSQRCFVGVIEKT